MLLDFNRRELALIASVLQTRVDELNPTVRRAKTGNHTTNTLKDELETLLHLKERLDFALLDHDRDQELPSNILYSDSFTPGESGWTPGHRHISHPPLM